MPGLTIATSGAPAAGAVGGGGTGSDPHPQSHPMPTAGRPRSRTSSPTRPPISPITPTLGPTHLSGTPTSGSIPLSNSILNFAQGRPVFTHSQPDQVAIAQLPPAEPISFDDNPDVLAIKSAISILQLQRARATADMQTLNKAKADALADPSAFVADLAAGRVGADGDPLFSFDDDDDLSSTSEDEKDERDAKGDIPMMTSATGASGDAQTRPAKRKTGKQKRGDDTSNTGTGNAGGDGSGNPSWRKLPKPQTVVRCPPINWAQYGVVGESLDKLHAEQVAAPTPGASTVLKSGGTFEFKASPGGSDFHRDGLQQQLQQPQPPSQRLVGIAAPFTPGRDKLEKKTKGGKR
ncbi:hypothetical protein B0H66DRAFT_543739 [Apodospora peruviana]|uniref:Uncharacterized protein n=1 Tax=Apodospora peruviana TaxID=516989 RepID=A0AAE0ISZ3_9PEZI|nr:hypothetical protein B0H66DRAFT_543739 [Apodospora peruviana]